jgi:carbohydrate-binding DOMON domain-containing protein
VLGDGILEVALPFAAFAPGIRSGDRFIARLVASEEGTDSYVLPSNGTALLTIPDLPLPNVVLDITDQTNDDYGPGSFTYPTDGVFKDGVFDVTRFTFGYDDTEYVFRIDLRGPVINEWGSPNGLAVQTVDIYIDVDGAANGARLLLPGRNAALTADYGWDYAIWAEGWTPGIFVPGDEGPVSSGISMTILTDPGAHRITIRVPKTALPGDPATWKIVAAVLSQEGFPSAGVWRVRDVKPQAEQWRIGGGSGATNETRIVELVWPEGSTPTQEEMLSTYTPSSASVDTLSPDDFPQIEMFGAP